MSLSSNRGLLSTRYHTTNYTTYAPLNTPKNPIDPTLNHRIPRPGRASTGTSRVITR